jgi:hypothetical protein
MDVHPDMARYAAMAGFDAAYLVLTDPARQQAMLSDPDTPPDTRLALARLRSGLAPDDPAAHFDPATAALLAGHPNEAAAATADCAGNAWPQPPSSMGWHPNRMSDSGGSCWPARCGWRGRCAGREVPQGGEPGLGPV